MSRLFNRGKPRTGRSRSIEELRETYCPGCQAHFIQVRIAGREGRYEAGILLGVDGMVAEVQLRRNGRICRVGTLWGDQLARAAGENVRRDRDGRPIVRWNRRVRVLQLVHTGPASARSCFNVVDLDARPDYLEAWKRLPASRQPRKPRNERGAA